MLRQPHRSCLKLAVTTKCYTRHYSLNHGLALDQPLQSYISTSNDPYLNLSIEHHFLQSSLPTSSLLFLYINRPSIILGRNQNPWTEVNLNLLNPAKSPAGLGKIDLVRRRSGGGTVFHDQGNVNWTVVCPSASFTRDKHAEMVVRALRSCGVARARVNERHDIVLDQGAAIKADGEVKWGAEDDAFSTPWSRGAVPLKVSGSAYKLTRGRALHHGTALLGSENLGSIGRLLRSPARAFIKGRGVESVNSPVGNLGVKNEVFVEEVQRRFGEMYGEVEVKVVGEECLGIEEVRRGYEELKSLDWTYLQTPQFSLSNMPQDGQALPSLDMAPRPKIPVHLNVKNGVVTDFEVNLPEHKAALQKALEGRTLHEIRDWVDVFEKTGVQSPEGIEVARWIQAMLPAPEGKNS